MSAVRCERLNAPWTGFVLDGHFALSTFDAEYILVKPAQLEGAIAAL